MGNCLIAPKNLLTRLQLFPHPPTVITELWQIQFPCPEEKETEFLDLWIKQILFLPKALVPSCGTMTLTYFRHTFPHSWGQTSCMTQILPQSPKNWRRCFGVTVLTRPGKWVSGNMEGRVSALPIQWPFSALLCLRLWHDMITPFSDFKIILGQLVQ